MKKKVNKKVLIYFISVGLLYLIIYSCGSSNNNTFKLNRGSKVDNRNGVIIVGDSNKVELKVIKIINNLELKTQNQIINNIHNYRDSISNIKEFKDSISNRIKNLENKYLLASKREKRKQILEQKQKQQKLLNTTNKRENVYKAVKNSLEKLLKENSKEEKQEEPKRVIYPKTAIEFINAIDHNTRIILTEPEYNISPNKIQNEIYNFYGIIENIKNLEIIGKNLDTVHIFSNAIDDPVIIFRNMNNLILKNLKIGHSEIVEINFEGCGNDADVLEFQESNDVVLDSNYLYGCGTQGIDYINGKNLLVKNSIIYDCTNGIFTFNSIQNAIFENCIFKNNKLVLGSFFSIYNSDVKITNSTIDYNTTKPNKEYTENDPYEDENLKYMFMIDNTSKVDIANSAIGGNKIDYLANNNENFKLKNITYGFPNNIFRKGLYPSKN